MKLIIEPKIALVDTKTKICVKKLPPLEKVKVTASMNLPWDQNEIYEAYAFFISDKNGEIDLSTQKPESGTYNWIDSMGLISSLKKVPSNEKNISQEFSIDNNFIIKISVECNGSIESESIERMFKNTNIKRQKINDKFIGELFYTGNSDNKTIILLGGSGGGMESIASIAGPLSSHGFNVLSVGYFGEEGLPKYLQEIPLEYFENVVSWIHNNPLLNSEIYLHGTSKGGELALLLASKYNDFTKVVANLPHAYCFQGLQGMVAAENVSSWSYQGLVLPYIKLDNNIFFEEQKRCISKNIPFGFANCYKNGVEVADNREEARIKVENSNADILLISGEEDNIWNTHDGCSEMIDVLRKNNYKHKYKLLSYKSMGHISLPVPNIIPISETLNMKMGDGVFSVGGTLKGNVFGQYDSWIKTIEFLKE